MEGYIGQDDDRRWSNEVDSSVDFDLVSAFILGKDVADALANAKHWAKVDAFMSDACDEELPIVRG
jgi:hypothetical protein